jgi:hypothetical protein
MREKELSRGPSCGLMGMRGWFGSDCLFSVVLVLVLVLVGSAHLLVLVLLCCVVVVCLRVCECALARSKQASESAMQHEHWASERQESGLRTGHQKTRSASNFPRNLLCARGAVWRACESSVPFVTRLSVTKKNGANDLFNIIQKETGLRGRRRKMSVLRLP